MRVTAPFHTSHAPAEVVVYMVVYIVHACCSNKVGIGMLR